MSTPANPDDLITWLRAQLDEDVRVAREATPGPWRWVDPGGKVKSALVGPGYPYQTVVPVAGGDVYPSKYDADHIARHDPARVLVEVDAKRRILDLHATGDFPYDPEDGPGDYSWIERCDGCGEATPCPTQRLLALPYADRPGYREEWRPA